ncbi:putative cyclin-dependent kinase F-2 [Phragmites australis]|uniref:putative cyclin-dependent kinase F-2 n=1 Tax=Phragmites australis TaxID=29695 RepID=UPI002D790613|nr:putative cyclin-dependent kinase F-2 [Phragmites australis]
MALTKRPPSRSECCSFAAMRRRGAGAQAATVPSAPKLNPPVSSTSAPKTRDAYGPRGVPTYAAGARNDVQIGSLESYKLFDKTGKGAFGVVRKALHSSTGEEVAIKSVRAGGEALLREAALLAACVGNPAVVELREVACGAEMDDLHLVMEFVGPSLHDVMRARRRRGMPFTESEARRVMRRLLGGVEMMHRQGVMHCDLKPGNVLVGGEDARGRVLKICDLGLAKFLAALPRDTPTHQLGGTLWYMAPEQLLGDNDCVAPVDLWSLGCLMAELVAGEPLFQEENVFKQVGEIVRLLGVPDEVSLMPLGVSASTPIQLRDAVPEERLSQAGFDVLRGLLEFDPKDRLTAAAALQMPWFAVEDEDAPSPARP